MNEELETAVLGVRELVAADGGEVEIVSLAEDTVTLRLILDGAECRECVMPRQFLEQVALDMMRAELPGIAAVVIKDPRES